MDSRNLVLKLAIQGIPPREIAEQVPLKLGTIHSYLWRARQGGMNIPKFKPPGRRTVGPRLEIPMHVADALKPHADQRRLTIQALTHALLEVIARDDMVDAVLDDQPKTTARKGANHV